MGGVVRSQVHRTEFVAVPTTSKGVPPTSPRPGWIAVETTPSERTPLEKKKRVNKQDWASLYKDPAIIRGQRTGSNMTAILIFLL